MTAFSLHCHPERSEGSAGWRQRQFASLGKRILIALAVAALLVIMTALQANASCVDELNKIVRTARGRITSSEGKPIRNAEITVMSSSGKTVFKTVSKRSGKFHLAVHPDKYRVEVSAERYIRLRYVVDLRSTAEKKPFDVPLQSSSECHDMRIIVEDEDRCSSEKLLPNLVLATSTVISGNVKDETSDPFKYSGIVLRKVSGSPLQPGQIETKTDADGSFKLEEAEPGTYRLLASPNRGFAQPEKLDCYDRRECSLEITLKANSTGLPYVGCPVQ